MRRDGGQVLVSAAEERRAETYIAALKEVGVSGERIVVITPAKLGRSLEESALGPQGASRPSRPPGINAHEACGGLAAQAANAAGIVLCGGADVAPERYGEEVLPGAGVEVVAERDVLEWQLLLGARAAKVPVWGVCRGLQVINVFLGGSLWQDLPIQRPSERPVVHSEEERLDALSHEVRVTAPETPLGAILARETPFVNSRHHQGIKCMADGLVAVAKAGDGLVEAAVLAGGEWWLRGVQWHPENLVALAQQRALWEDFAQAISASGAALSSPGPRRSRTSLPDGSSGTSGHAGGEPPPAPSPALAGA